ncbi:uncharacterized protein BX663DRAFT_502189 [Cokeromyces recurvatus]|uniref:uncharacterized protein n=1 Tax=Cokeromyces recurvatus TaxID=90255 RepID=UPI00221F8CFA|nr:uncharacterized protein BX663DRAFT_502189 [Cokeromyces recurvatus]KAI7905233.1 hypothetical protein BX663DRAFT_502189 [Cokeromyces recurvatus]
MYFTLPKTSNSSLLSTESNASTMTEDRISEIIQNLDDHWGSPPILTPDTLSHILNHQWIINDDIKQQDIKKVYNSSIFILSI